MVGMSMGDKKMFYFVKLKTMMLYMIQSVRRKVYKNFVVDKCLTTSADVSSAFFFCLCAYAAVASMIAVTITNSFFIFIFCCFDISTWQKYVYFAITTQKSTALLGICVIYDAKIQRFFVILYQIGFLINVSL